MYRSAGAGAGVGAACQQACTYHNRWRLPTCLTCSCAHLTLVLCTDYILQGPLLSSCGLDATTLDLAEWVTTGKQLAKQLNFDHDQLDNVQK